MIGCGLRYTAKSSEVESINLKLIYLLPPHSHVSCAKPKGYQLLLYEGQSIV